jgi:hypothetical protein
MISLDDTKKRFFDWIDVTEKTILSDIFGFYGTKAIIPRRSQLAWVIIKNCILDTLCKHNVEHCLYYGSLIGYARFGHEEPYMDDWDVVVPNDKENVLKLEKAIEEIQNNNKGCHIVRALEHGFQFYAKRGSWWNPEDRNKGFPCIGQIDFFYIHRTEDGKIEYPLKSSDGKKWVPKNEGEPFNKLFPAKLLTVNNDTLYFPRIADSIELFDWLKRGYGDISNIKIYTHFQNRPLNFPKGTDHKHVLQSFFDAEDIAKDNMENIVKTLNIKEWPTITKRSDTFMPYSVTEYMSLLPNILSCVDSMTSNGECIVPSTHLPFISDIILYRPLINIKIDGVIQDEYLVHNILLEKHKSGLIPSRQQMINSDVTSIVPFNSLCSISKREEPEQAKKKEEPEQAKKKEEPESVNE